MRQHYSPDIYPQTLPEGWDATPLDHGEFMQQVTQMTPEAFLGDRIIQAKVDYTLNQQHIPPRLCANRAQALHQDSIDAHTPTPVRPSAPSPLTLVRNTPQTGALYIYEAFSLREPPRGQHYYFFPDGTPVAEQPDYLRPADLVPSGIYIHSMRHFLSSIPFKKGLERVPASGGEVTRFNYVTGEWEPYDLDGQYQPTLKQRIAYFVGRAAQGLRQQH